MPSRIEIHPLTPSRWADLVTLFGGPGGSQVRQCWCMYYRRSGTTAVPQGCTPAEHNKRSLRALVASGTVPGLLGYRDGEPIAWISLGPRADYAKLERSPVMRPVDDRPVWSVVCFYTARSARGAGVAAAMLRGAVDYARSCGARLIEGYPVDKARRSDDDNLWFGNCAMFARAGFVEVARRKPTRPVMRRALRPRRP
jgi:GNAT superfamily N-acetyltransferase